MAPRSCKLLYRGKRISAIAIMSYDGVLDVQIENETVDGECFLRFIEKTLLPTLMPFDGISIVIMDNASIHVMDLIAEVGALVHFLPAYSPDYSPIEECFAKVKSLMRAIKWRWSTGYR